MKRLFLFAVAALGSIALHAETDNAAEEWNELGVGRFQDCIVGPVFAKDFVTNAPTNVTIYESVESPGLYKIITPWKDSYGGTENLVIDLTDPEYGKFSYLNTGIKFEEELGNVYIQSLSDYLEFALGWDKIMMLASEYARFNISYDSEAKRVELPYGHALLYLPESTIEGFDAYTWWPNDEAVYYISGFIEMPGAASIGGVTIDSDANAPVEYYDLRGVKVATPVKGQILIRRQGSVCTKVFI